MPFLGKAQNINWRAKSVVLIVGGAKLKLMSKRGGFGADVCGKRGAKMVLFHVKHIAVTRRFCRALATKAVLFGCTDISAAFVSDETALRRCRHGFALGGFFRNESNCF